MAINPRGIVTPEAVVLDFETAGIASRAIARSIDALIQVALLFALLLLVGIALQGSAGVVVAIVGLAAVVLGYPILCEVLMRGRSPGKAVFGLRVVTDEGAPTAARHAFIRSTVGIVDFLIPPVGLCAVLSSLLSPRSQRLGDLVAGTIVLRERTAAPPATAVWFHPPPGLEGYVPSLDVTTVTDAQLTVIRSFLLRVHELAPEARAAMAVRLATPIATAMHHRAPPGVHPEIFLVCVAAACQRRRWAQAQVAPPPPPPPPPPLARAVVVPGADEADRYAPPS